MKAKFLKQNVAPLTKTQEALVLQSLWVFHEVADLLWVLSPTMMWLRPWLGGQSEVDPVPRHGPDCFVWDIQVSCYVARSISTKSGKG